MRAPRIGRVAFGRLDATEGDVLVEVGVPAPDDARVLVVGSDPYDERITCLADLRVEGSLPEEEFDLVALADARPRRDLVVVENAIRALRPGGVLVCGGTWPLRRVLAGRFGHVARHGVGPWCVVEARKGRDAGD